MNTSSCTKRLKEVLHDYEDVYEDEGLNPPVSTNDFLKNYKPHHMELYPNGTLLLYTSGIYDRECGEILMLAPKVETYDVEETNPAKIPYADSKPSIDEVSANYEKNKSFVTFL